MLPSVPLVPPLFGLGGAGICPPRVPWGLGTPPGGGTGREHTPRVGFLGKGNDEVGKATHERNYGLMTPRHCHPRPPNHRGSGSSPGSALPLCPPRAHCVCSPRPHVLRSPPALAAAVTCHRVPLSPPRLMEMAGDGVGAAALSPCHGPAGLSPAGDGSLAWLSPPSAAWLSLWWHSWVPSCHSSLYHWWWHPVPPPHG